MATFTTKFPLATRYERGKIFPIFIPFLGCKNRCIFCSQQKQTGVLENSLSVILQNAERDFHVFLQNNTSPIIDIAFFGGTFTALNDDDFNACLNIFSKLKKIATAQGITVLGRCSTRPDELSDIRLNTLIEKGINLVELGVQSFNTKVLNASKRGYGLEIFHNLVEGLRTKYGFEVGIQLMAGLPEQSIDVFIVDVDTAIKQKPDCMRFYPCLVPKNTELAKLYYAKKYTPWTYEETVQALGLGLAMAWNEKIPVIRLSVAPEDGFDKEIVAGVRSESIGSAIMGQALLETIHYQLRTNKKPYTELYLNLPKSAQGYLFGEKNILKKEYEKILPLSNINYLKNSLTSSQAELIFVNKD